MTTTTYCEESSGNVFPEIGSGSGRALIDALQASPHREIEIEPERGPIPVRDVPSMDQQTDASVEELLDIGRRCASTRSGTRSRAR